MPKIKHLIGGGQVALLSSAKTYGAYPWRKLIGSVDTEVLGWYHSEPFSSSCKGSELINHHTGTPVIWVKGSTTVWVEVT